MCFHDVKRTISKSGDNHPILAQRSWRSDLNRRPHSTTIHRKSNCYQLGFSFGKSPIFTRTYGVRLVTFLVSKLHVFGRFCPKLPGFLSLFSIQAQVEQSIQGLGDSSGVVRQRNPVDLASLRRGVRDSAVSRATKMCPSVLECRGVSLRVLKAAKVESENLPIPTLRQ